MPSPRVKIHKPHIACKHGVPGGRTIKSPSPRSEQNKHPQEDVWHYPLKAEEFVLPVSAQATEEELMEKMQRSRAAETVITAIRRRR